MQIPKHLVVDIHTHIYLPRYIDLLRSRKIVPRIQANVPLSQPFESGRLIILPEEENLSNPISAGRPIGPNYYDTQYKIEFMKRHNIQISVLRYVLIVCSVI